MEYKILTEDSAKGLAHMVQEQIKKGWTVSGGLSCVSRVYTGRDGDVYTDTEYNQAMVLHSGNYPYLLNRDEDTIRTGNAYNIDYVDATTIKLSEAGE